MEIFQQYPAKDSLMEIINKVFWCIGNPLTLCFLGSLVAIVLGYKGFRRLSTVVGGLSLLLFYALATPALTLLTGRPLEKNYPYVPIDEIPSADAIICLGGGIGANTNFCPYPLLYTAADRSYYAATLWKMRKAPIVIVSGEGSENSDGKFLLDLGVSKEAIILERDALNTEENAKCIQKLFSKNGKMFRDDGGIPKVLLVTSAWHMRRSLLMFEKFASGIEVVSAATDHECLRGAGKMQWEYLVPNAACIEMNLRFLHEWAGWLFYKWFRG